MANIFAIPLDSQVLVFEGIKPETAQYIAKQVEEFRRESLGRGAILAIIMNDDHTLTRVLVAESNQLGKLMTKLATKPALSLAE